MSYRLDDIVVVNTMTALVAEICVGIATHNNGWIFIGGLFIFLLVVADYVMMDALIEKRITNEQP